MTRHTRLLVIAILVLAALGTTLPALAQQGTPISIGDTVEGTLTTSQPQMRYTFSGEAGQIVTITLASEDFDAYLTLEDAGGMYVASDDDSAGNRNSRIGPLPLPANGTYTIIAASLYGSDTGDYTLTLAAPTIETLTAGAVVEGELTSADLFKTFYFEAEESDSVAVTLRSTDFDAYLEMRSASGAFSWSDDDGAGDLNSRIGPLALPEAGLYVITATSLGRTSTGAFTLELAEVQVVSLVLDTPVEASLAAGEPLYFSFEGESGQTVDLRVDSGNTIDTTLTLRGPDGYQIGYNDDFTGIDPALVATTLTSTGTYTAVVQGRYPDESGPLTVSLAAVQLPSLDDGPQRVRLSDKQSTGQVVFDGAAGETVTLALTVESGDKLPSYIEVNQGNMSIAYVSGDSLAGLTLTLVLPADGVVLVKLNDYSYSVKIIGVALERAAAE